MSFLQLSSNNPDFSYNINKNPSSLPNMKTIRFGSSIGYFSKGRSDQYNVYFKDSFKEQSVNVDFKDPSFDYNSTGSYSAGVLYNQLIWDYFRNTINDQISTDTNNYTNSIFLNTITVHNKNVLEIFKSYFKDYSIDYTEHTRNCFSVKISAENTMQSILKLAITFTLFITIQNREEFNMDEQVTLKYAKLLQEVNAPYFIKYYFKSRFIISPNIFEKTKQYLNTTNENYTFGDTHKNRINFVKNSFNYNNSIVDLGCGEGRHTKEFFKLCDKSIYAIDIDESLTKKVERIARSKQFRNLSTFNSLNDFITNYNGEKVDVVCSEVIEHMELSEVPNFIETVIDNVNFNSIIITTPDKNFNTNYHNLSEFRHDDHRFELTETEFKDLIHTIAPQLNKTYYKVGDSINSVTPTIAVKLTR